MKEHLPVVVIGAGQAGLSVSHCLKELGIEHLVLEKRRIGHAWRSERWDSFCLVTPNWQCQLPGYPYRGPDPHGFMLKDEIVEYLDGYVASFAPPVEEGVEVRSLRRRGRRFELTTSKGELTADQVVLATGGYPIPTVPKMAAKLPDRILQVHSSDYRNPGALPPGEVLVVGSGQSGCQIAEDLHLAGRKVHLAVGNAPRCARRYRGKDVVEWLHHMGYYDLPIDRHPNKEQVRDKTNHYVTGRDGGRDINLRKFALEGMQLHGQLSNVEATHLEFLPGLAANLDAADAVYASINRSIDAHIEREDLAAPPATDYVPVWSPGEETLRLELAAANLAAVIWCIGFQTDFAWVDLPLFDSKGHPVHERGITTVSGAYFIGLPWLHTWGSGRFSGIARDAHHIVERIQEHATRTLLTGVEEVRAMGS